MSDNTQDIQNVVETNVNDAKQPFSLGRREIKLNQYLPTHSIHQQNIKGDEGPDVPEVESADSTAHNQYTQLNMQLSGTSLLAQIFPAASITTSSADSILLPHLSQQRPWQKPELAISRSLPLQAGISQDSASKDAAAAVPELETTASATRQLPLPHFLSPRTPSAQAHDSQDADPNSASTSKMADAAVAAHRRDTGLQPNQPDDQDLLNSPRRTAVPLYAIFSPSRQRGLGESGEASMQGGSGAADGAVNSALSKTIGTASLGTGLSVGPEPAKEMRPIFGRRAFSAAGPTSAAGPNLEAVPHMAEDPQLAAGSALAAIPSLAAAPMLAAVQRRNSLELLPDLDELLPDGETGHTGHVWRARPLSTSGMPVSNAGRRWGLGASGGAFTTVSAVKNSAGTESASGNGAPKAAPAAARLDTRPAAAEESARDAHKQAEHDSAASAVVTQIEEGGGLLDDNSTLSELSLQESLHGNERSPGSSNGMGCRGSELAGRLREATERCAELEAELARREAAAQLQASETAQLAVARCDSLTRRLAESEAAAQLARSERNCLKKKCKELAAELVGKAAAMQVLADERDGERMRCEEMEGMLADREYAMEQGLEESSLERGRCDELQQKLVEAEARSEEVAAREADLKNAEHHLEVERSIAEEHYQAIEERHRKLLEAEAALDAKEQLWAMQQPRILKEIRQMRALRRRMQPANSQPSMS